MFDFPYVQGYTAALLDVKQVLEYIDNDLKRHGRKRTAKEYGKIIDCMIQGRAILREDTDIFVRCSKSGGYELFNQRTRKVEL